MSAKTSSVLLLTVVLLTIAANGLNWQGTGNMNNSVITKIWDNLSTKLDSAFGTDANAILAVTKNISDQLNAQWNPAWNVVLVVGVKTYDTILYGYAFNNHWMWYNGVPSSVIGSSTLVTLVVWKDYNCQNWKYISSNEQASSTFTADQNSQVATAVGRISQNQLTNDVWGATHDFMTDLQTHSGFSSGAYTIVMNQGYFSVKFYGYVCRVGDNYYNSKNQLGNAIIPSAHLGIFYMFQTR